MKAHGFNQYDRGLAYRGFVAEFLQFQLRVAEFVAPHKGMLVGEDSWLFSMTGCRNKKLTRIKVDSVRQDVRGEFERFMDRCNPDSAFDWMDYLDWHESVQQAYVNALRDRLDGSVRTLKFQRDVVSGVYQQKNGTWRAVISLPGSINNGRRGAKIGVGTYGTITEAADARNRYIADNGLTWAKPSIL